MEVYLLVGLILLLAGFTHGFSGFGAIILALPLLTLFLDIKVVIPLCALMGLMVTLFVFWQMYSQISWREIWPLILAAAPGTLVGVLLAKYLDQKALAWILGVSLVCYSLTRLCLRGDFLVLRAKVWTYVFGFLSGFLGGSLSASGPPVIVYTSLKAWSSDQIKATLQGFFLMLNLVIISLHAVVGLTTLRVLTIFAAAFLPLLAGVWLGSLLYGKIKERYYRQTLLILLGLMGLLIIWKH